MTPEEEQRVRDTAEHLRSLAKIDTGGRRYYTRLRRVVIEKVAELLEAALGADDASLQLSALGFAGAYHSEACAPKDALERADDQVRELRERVRRLEKLAGWRATAPEWLEREVFIRSVDTAPRQWTFTHVPTGVVGYGDAQDDAAWSVVDALEAARWFRQQDGTWRQQ